MYDPLFDRARNIAFVARPSREGIPRQRSVRTGFSADTEVSPYIHYNYGTKELQMSLACVPKLDGVASAYLLLKYTFNLTGAITLPIKHMHKNKFILKTNNHFCTPYDPTKL